LELKSLINPDTVLEKGIEIQEFLCEGGTFQDVFGFSDDTMKAKYEIAYDHYRRKEYEQAIEGFSYLANLNPYTNKYWQALAAAQIKLKRYSDAINSYLASALIEPNDPNPPLYTAHCYLELNQLNETAEALKQTIRVAARSHVYREIEEKATTWLEKINNDLEKQQLG
jgi:type III secretion system low calcium response chaperone LcrH/SycD